jgi:antitoxin (DNA-binding transcriptional repressor) of toxin-antitoxin stability system
MVTATVRDLRTRFPRLKALIAREGELLVTDRGRPAYVLRPYSPPPIKNTKTVDYFSRLRLRQPKPLSRARSRALDEADRGER